MMSMEKRYRYFDKPTQVAFWDYDGDHYVGGIAYEDIVICGNCGGIYDLDELYEFAPEGKTPVLVYDDWVDIGAEILGFDISLDSVD